MMKTATENRIIDLISGVCRVPASKIHTHTNLRDDLHLDSIDMLLLIAALESDFKVYLTSEEAAAIETVHDVSYFMQRNAA